MIITVVVVYVTADSASFTIIV